MTVTRSLNEELIRAVIRCEAIAVQDLLERGADSSTTGGVTLLDRNCVSDRNNFQETVLMTTARHGQTDLVQRLAQMGAELNATNKIGDTALYLAAERGHLYSVKALCELGAEVNTANLGGWTPLMMASALGSIEIVEILLKYKADHRPKNNWNGSALSEARKSFRSNQAVELLIRAGASE
ncbi:MAG: hypothetical protein DCF19_01290 [Pseudanabaena frigida]|uniref:Uncharacterized protein n=1 Tax=Pseudanabaena frigida TaxID=945775 RepID=A0A2W4WJ14_9CYAN|nr:MAG: hypothetical protein DCF19_01290 [Pseudanabaena frigida]